MQAMPVSPKAPTFGAGAIIGENKISIRAKIFNKKSLLSHKLESKKA